MSNFANSLLNLLLGWLRTVFSGLLSMLQGGGTGFFTWMGRHWMGLALVLVAAGLIIDGLVYIIRWRPQYVWRSRLQRFSRSREDVFAEEPLEESVSLPFEGFNFADTPIPDLEYAPPQEEVVFDLLDPAPLSPEEPFDYSQLPGAESAAEERRRRSTRHGRRAQRSSGRFRLSDLSDTSRAAYPEPPVDARSAFHEAVYPSLEPAEPQPDEEDPFADA